MKQEDWQSIWDESPPINDHSSKSKVYVLAVDAKSRMSVGWAYRYSTGQLGWTFAKPIGQPTHWMDLPEPPQKSNDSD